MHFMRQIDKAKDQRATRLETSYRFASFIIHHHDSADEEKQNDHHGKFGGKRTPHIDRSNGLFARTVNSS